MGQGPGAAPRARGRKKGRPDLGRMASALRQFLEASAIPPSGFPFASASRLAARAWAEELLDGYALDPARVLSGGFPTPSSPAGEMVVVVGVDYVSVCPHHLLPSRGVAHIGYVPADKVLGFGDLAKLVRCLGHRLVLQEDLARQVADALCRHLKAKGAACLLDAEQACLSCRGERQSRARTHAEAFAGSFARSAELRGRFMRKLGGGGRR